MALHIQRSQAYGSIHPGNSGDGCWQCCLLRPVAALPLEYEENACDWPVVYLPDGGILFPMLTPYQLMMEINEPASPAVMVGQSGADAG